MQDTQNILFIFITVVESCRKTTIRLHIPNSIIYVWFSQDIHKQQSTFTKTFSSLGGKENFTLGKKISPSDFLQIDSSKGVQMLANMFHLIHFQKMPSNSFFQQT